MATREVDGDVVVDVKPTTVMFKPYQKAGADEALDAEIAALEAAQRGTQPEPEPEDEPVPAVTVEEKNWQQRYGDLRRHSQKIERELNDRIKVLETKSETAARNALNPPATEEELSAWMAEYPQVARIVETIAERKAKELDKAYEGRLNELTTVKEEVTRTKAEQAISKRHNDFEVIRNDPAWYAWLETKSPAVQSIIYNGTDNVADICDVIDTYKAQTGFGKKKPGPKPNPRDVEDAPSGTGRGPGVRPDAVWSESRVASLTDAEYDKYEAEISASVQAGTFVYDRQKSAR